MVQNKTMPFVTVYTITYNQMDLVRKTMIGLSQQDYPPNRYEIVVLDDGSTDRTWEILETLAKHSPVYMKLLRKNHEADYLSAKRWNQCIAASSSDAEVYVQVDDVQVRPDLIMQHTKWHLLTGDYIVTGSKFEGDAETWDLAACRRGCLAGPSASAAECNFLGVWGASLSFTRRMMQKVWQEPFDMPYDERMTGWGFHETEFAYRMQMAGAKPIYDPAAGVFHRNHTAETELSRGLKRDALVQRGGVMNEQYLRKKHGLDDLPWW